MVKLRVQGPDPGGVTRTPRDRCPVPEVMRGDTTDMTVDLNLRKTID